MPVDRIIARTKGLYDTFERKGGSAPTATHYCAGCGHGILHKLIGEAMADLKLQDRAIMISPVGCAVFGYYYFDCGNVQAAHGRAPAVGTGLARMLNDAVVLSYQGDGDLCSIGLNETIHAANRGERMAVFFINNAVYGMTGGQMAPTTLLGQKTTTSPYGREPNDSGHPIHACELIDQLPAPLYIERCSLADSKRIRSARKAIRKALEVQRDRKGFTFVEFLSPCPTNLHCSPLEAAGFAIEKLEQEYPLGCLRDRTTEALTWPRRHPVFVKDELDTMFSEIGAPSDDSRLDPEFLTRHIRIAGFGGQGVLSLGLMLAMTGQCAQRHVTWFPSYGPEQRGGTANCSVVISGQPIGSPLFSNSDILLALNQPSLERFGAMMSAAGVILYDSAIESGTGAVSARTIAVPAREIAAAAGDAKAANTAMFGALCGLQLLPMPSATYECALKQIFALKPKLIPLNEKVFRMAVCWAKENMPLH